MAFPTTYTDEKPAGDGRYTMPKFKDIPKMKLRILSDFIEGKSVWGEKDGKPYPYRVRPDEQMQVSWIGINKFNNQPNKIKKFIAAVVWNYMTKQVEVFECSNGYMMKDLFNYDKDEDWGDLKGYDISVTKSGTGTETRYLVVPSNKIPFVDAEAKAQAKLVSLNALFTGTNPFELLKETQGEIPQEIVTDEVNTVEDVSGEIPF